MSGSWLPEPRRLRRGEEHRLAVSPAPPEIFDFWCANETLRVSSTSAKRRRRRRTRRRALESRDAEREWRVRSPRLIRDVERESTRKPSCRRQPARRQTSSDGTLNERVRSSSPSEVGEGKLVEDCTTLPAPTSGNTNRGDVPSGLNCERVGLLFASWLADEVCRGE